MLTFELKLRQFTVSHFKIYNIFVFIVALFISSPIKICYDLKETEQLFQRITKEKQFRENAYILIIDK